MTKINARGAVSIVEIIFYLPSLATAIAICVRHGFGRNSGWIYLVIFSLVRLIGSGCQLATYNKPDDESLYKWYAILDSVALSPLLLATLGFLSRSIDSINRNIKGPFTAAHFRLLQVLITVGLILSIAGGTSGKPGQEPIKISTETKVGIVLYIIAYVAISFITLRTMFDLSHADMGERRLVLAVIIALPIILIRLVYSILVAFSHRSDFNILTGSVPILVVMAVIEEFAVVLDYLIVGVFTPVIPIGQRGPILTRTKKASPLEQRSNGGQV